MHWYSYVYWEKKKKKVTDPINLIIRLLNCNNNNPMNSPNEHIKNSVVFEKDKKTHVIYTFYP